MNANTRAPSRSEGEVHFVYGIGVLGLPEMIDILDAGSIPVTQEGMDALLQYEMAANSMDHVFIARGRSLIADTVA